jgi:hypothetical protein
LSVVTRNCGWNKETTPGTRLSLHEDIPTLKESFGTTSWTRLNVPGTLLYMLRRSGENPFQNMTKKSRYM